MRAIVIHESLTGNTARAGAMIADEFRDSGIDTSVYPVTDIDLQVLSEADLVVLGSWVDGAILFGQKPGRSSRLLAMPNLTDKTVVVYCTYAIRLGHALIKLERIAADLGGNVVGGLAMKRGSLETGSRNLVKRVLSVLEIEPVGT